MLSGQRKSELGLLDYFIANPPFCTRVKFLCAASDHRRVQIMRDMT